MDDCFKGKLALVTGASGGLGLACVQALVARGARVAMISANEERLRSAATGLYAKGKVEIFVLDLSRTDSIPGAVREIRTVMGEPDILIQCAGILHMGSAFEIDSEAWGRVMSVNTKGMFFLMRETVMQSMMHKKHGTIVNISSMAGLRGMPQPLCSAAYSASKGAVIALTKQAAVEWGPLGIRVNAVAPGGISPDEGNPLPELFPGITPLGRGCTRTDVANTVLFFCSEAARAITGEVLVVAGGAQATGC